MELLYPCSYCYKKQPSHSFTVTGYYSNRCLDCEKAGRTVRLPKPEKKQTPPADVFEQSIQAYPQQLEQLAEQTRNDKGELKQLQKLVEQSHSDLGELKQLTEETRKDMDKLKQLQQLAKQTHTDLDEVKQGLAEFKQGFAEVRGFVQRLQYIGALLLPLLDAGSSTAS